MDKFIEPRRPTKNALHRLYRLLRHLVWERPIVPLPGENIEPGNLAQGLSI